MAREKNASWTLKVQEVEALDKRQSLRVLSLFTALPRMSFVNEEEAIYLSCHLIPGDEVSTL